MHIYFYILQNPIGMPLKLIFHKLRCTAVYAKWLQKAPLKWGSVDKSHHEGIVAKTKFAIECIYIFISCKIQLECLLN